MKYVRVGWNVAVALVVAWLLISYRYWLFVLPIQSFGKDGGSLASIMNGPIYIGLFVGWGLLCSTAYHGWSRRRLGVFVAATVLPFLGMAFVIACDEAYSSTDYYAHGGLYLFASLVVWCSRRSLPRLVLGILRACGRLLGTERKAKPGKR